MKLLSLEFEDKQTGWKLAKMDFNPDMNLLVGVSGSGKTKILKAIETLQGVATDARKYLNYGIKWNATIGDGDDSKYTWQGEYSTKSFSAVTNDAPYISSEEISKDGTTILFRKGTRLSLNDKEIPSVSPQFSSPLIFSGDLNVGKINRFFASVIINQLYKIHHVFAAPTSEVLAATSLVKSKKDLLASKYPTPLKLILAKYVAKDLFDKIEQIFRSIFQTFEYFDVSSEANPSGTFNVLLMKEKGITEPIKPSDFSSGMNRALHIIADSVLSEENDVVLIDEFEASLGVNCLDEITDHVVSDSLNRQYIVTSHHPYIINNIPTECWKIITRKGSVVIAHEALDFDIGGRSRQDAFSQLISSDSYREGISA